MINEIDVSRLYYIQGEIIDIRDRSDFLKGSIPNAINILDDLLTYYPEIYLKKNKKYYLYCQSGMRSKETCLSLAVKGYQVVNIIGGYDKWLALRKKD